MTVGFLELSNNRFRLTDREHSEEVSEAQPFFKLTDGELTFRAEQITADDEKTPAQRILYFLKHFTRMFWGYFTLPSIYEECNPIMLEADLEVKNTRFREQTIVFSPSCYAPDIHDYTAPKLDGGKDFAVTPIAYKVNERELSRRRFEILAERLGLSTLLLLIPVLLMIASAAIRVPTLGMIAIFAAIALYPLIPIMLVRWNKAYKLFDQKARQKAIELNESLHARKY